VFVVFGGALTFTLGCKEVGQVEARAKVIALELQALLVALHCTLKSSSFLLADTSVVISVSLGRSTEFSALSLDPDRLLKRCSSWCPLLQLVVDLAFQEMGVS